MKGKTNALVEVYKGSELLYISLTVDGAESALTDNMVITIEDMDSGKSQTVTYEGVKTPASVVAGHKHRVSVNRIDGYIPPLAVEFTSVNGYEREVTIDYVSPPIGAFIYTKDEQLVAPENWDVENNDNIIGVYLGTSTHKIVLRSSKETISSTFYDGYTWVWNCVSEKRGIEDYDGYGNMQKSLSISERNEAFYETNKIIFPNGKNAYIPSAGEMKMINDNISAIGRCWAAIKGVSGSLLLWGRQYWTSTLSKDYSFDGPYGAGFPIMVWDENEYEWIDGWSTDSQEDADNFSGTLDGSTMCYVLPICLY